MQILSIDKRKRVHAIAFSPDGSELAAVGGDYSVRIWNLATGEARISASSVARTASGYDLAYLDHERIIFAGLNLEWWEPTADKWNPISVGFVWGRRIKISPTKQFLAEVNQTRSTAWPAPGQDLRVYSTDDWTSLPTMPEAEDTTGGVAFSPDGRLLATGHIVSVGQRNRSFAMLPGFQLPVNEYDYLVHVREMPSGRILQTLAGWQQAVTHLAFSPDGSVLAGTAGPRLRIWNLQSDRELAIHKRGPKHFQGLSFARDGNFLATVSNDATVRIWDTRTWEEHSQFTWRIGALLNISFAPDGLRAAAGSEQGKVVIWDVE